MFRRLDFNMLQCGLWGPTFAWLLDMLQFRFMAHSMCRSTDPRQKVMLDSFSECIMTFVSVLTRGVA